MYFGHGRGGAVEPVNGICKNNLMYGYKKEGLPFEAEAYTKTQS